MVVEATPVTRYMTVTVDFVPNAMNLSMWMSTVEFYASEITHYPFEYTFIGKDCDWKLHSNMELTPNLIISIGEQAERICQETIKHNQNRKISNR